MYYYAVHIVTALLSHYVKPEDRWSLNGNPVEICDDFVYLGLLFHY
jgi:hypothetical protein